MLQLVARCKSIVDGQLAALESHWPRPTSADGVRVGDSLPYSIEAFIRSAKGKLGGLDEWTKRMVGLAVEANRDSVDDRLAREIKRAIGVDVDHLLHANGPLLQAMKSATKDNVALISSIPEKYFGRVTETLTAGWTGGVRWESLVDQIQRDGDITENRAKFIARDQTAKMNESFNRERCTQVGIEQGEWLCSLDERTRPNHAAMEGVIYDLNGEGPLINDDGEPCFPGDDYNCRCTFAPHIDMGDAALGFGTNEQQEEIAS
jgi:SPP1 gp7 family putative phage head morphogenesis protein